MTSNNAVEMQKVKIDERKKSFEEVNLGYTKEEAIEEASRCLQCKKPKCTEGCPASVNIPLFLKHIKEDEPVKASEVIRQTNNLPGVCGRVCPQEEQCEQSCILSKSEKAIKIGYLERYAADNCENISLPKKPKKTGKKIAIVGSGPASLTAAADLCLLSHTVDVYEALHKPGGVLTYGIPSFRLKKDIVDQEIEYIQSLGANIMFDKVIGLTIDLKELSEDYDAVFVGVGAGTPNFIGIPGEMLNNVYSANEFLVRNVLMRSCEKGYDTPIKTGTKVVVIGGGNVAMDSARTALRLGAEVTVIYRRSFEEMPARIEEIENAQEEGIKFLIMTGPVKINGKECVESIECIQMMLGQKDESGRRKPMPIEGSEFTIECDQVIVAIGTTPNPLFINKCQLTVSDYGTLAVNSLLQTSNPKVFAGGDIISGSSTVINAIKDGKTAAKNIHDFITHQLKLDDFEDSEVEK